MQDELLLRYFEAISDAVERRTAQIHHLSLLFCRLRYISLVYLRPDGLCHSWSLTLQRDQLHYVLAEVLSGSRLAFYGASSFHICTSRMALKSLKQLRVTELCSPSMHESKLFLKSRLQVHFVRFHFS